MSILKNGKIQTGVKDQKIIKNLKNKLKIELLKS